MEEFGLTPKQEQVMELWMGIKLTRAYYAFIAERAGDDKAIIKNMTDEQADKWIAALNEWRERA